MRRLLDTNVLIAAFIARGSCSELLEHAISNHTVVSSDYIPAQFRKKEDELEK